MHPPPLPPPGAGRGSYGAVHKARILSSGDIVAVKIIPVSEQDEIAGIQREIAMLRECNHPNIVKYYVSYVGWCVCGGGGGGDDVFLFGSAADGQLAAM